MGHMLRRRTAALVALVVTAFALTITALPDLGFLITREKAWPGAGEPVPHVASEPLVRLAVAGDTGTGDANQAALAEQMELRSADDPVDALLLLGDLIYEDGEVVRVDEVLLQPYAELLDAGAVLVPILGNHDYRSGEETEILDRLGRDHPWYVEELGPVRIVALDSMLVGEVDQTRWLEQTLAERTTADWTVVIVHHPPYSSGMHGGNDDILRRWVPLFAEHGVDLVLSGHDHNYERFVPRDGVTYVVSGAGAKLRPVGRSDETEVSTSTRHYLDVLVYADRVDVHAVDSGGRLVDSFTLDGA